MQYRYQETLAWIIPGFYFLCFLVVEILFIYPSSAISKWIVDIFSLGLSDAMVAFLVFAIPICSFIMGWMLNGWSGYLFRKIMCSQITKAYNSVYCRDNDGKLIENYIQVDDKKAKETFNVARRVIRLEDVDRFYYRYVASRNMYFAQVLITIISIFFLLNTLCSNLVVSLVSLLISCLMLAIYYYIVARDLNTHAKYVFVYYKLNKKTES